ncbi:TPR-like protein [Punctularia strigosozonata HHB-11173 SS5]|uniref:TPR-like protein n=1 Tax=Punctularia strigosozonata (strain HHB-11173) TaxID=741275 RepID=UPI0004417B94|nr:TPR-like protein [Punctularia strigosozonata HHB-11173 SS5]EIN11305.1 TPR-like protein [Punctularia strigosozonata HHB-11173 SS5]
MAGVSLQPDREMAANIRRAVKDCRDRGLLYASKWASELYLALPSHLRQPQATDQPIHNGFNTSTPARPRSPPMNISFDLQGSPSTTTTIEGGTSSHPMAPNSHPWLGDNVLDIQDEDKVDVARACMEAKEFQRAAFMLTGCVGPKAAFLAHYSQYLAAEKKALNDWHALDGKRGQPVAPINKGLQSLCDKVVLTGDPWILFLRALFLYRLSRREEAIEAALLSIAAYPWNWSTWLILKDCVEDANELAALIPLIPLPPNHPLVQFFQIKIMNELQSPTEEDIAVCDALLQPTHFPTSCWVKALRATVLYNMHDFAAAEMQFEQIIQMDPFRIDDMDIYSNILYVQDHRLKLSRVAREFLNLDKDRPETMCIVGNHYSLRGEHERAIKYFKRAVLLDRTYTSAWTLIGHEYVEMKNSHAAIESYRRAVETNRKDYRAWFGLGQAYELLNMHQYALYYFHRATALRPYDTRMWQAQAQCYEELGRTREAIECYKRALIAGADPNDPSIHVKVAKLFDSIGEFTEATAHHRRVVEVARATGKPIAEYSQSALYVARQQVQQLNGDLELAKDYLEQIVQSNVEEVKDASEYLKKVMQMIARNQTVAHGVPITTVS